MKKVLIATNILFICIILFLGCDEKSSNITPLIAPADCDTCKQYRNIDLAGTVTSDVIKKLSTAYFEDLDKSRISGTQDPDAMSVTFELDEIKNLIWRMDTAICYSGCNKVPIGIKFYYIKYDNTIDGLTPDVQAVINANPNKHSLVMVPAYLVGDKWYDWDYNHLPRSCDFRPIVDSIVGVMNLNGTNHGGIGPPPAPGTFATIQPR